MIPALAILAAVFPIAKFILGKTPVTLITISFVTYTMGIGEILKHLAGATRGESKRSSSKCPNCEETVLLSMERSAPKCSVHVKKHVEAKMPKMLGSK